MDRSFIALFVLFSIVVIIALVLSSLNTSNVYSLNNNINALTEKVHTRKFDGIVSTDLNMNDHNIEDINQLNTNGFILTSITNPPLDTSNLGVTSQAVVNQALQPNQSLFFSSGLGELKQTDGTTTISYVALGGSSDFLPLDGSLPMLGD